MTTHFHPVPKPAPRVKPPKGLRKRNHERAAADFKREYGSIARTKWVRLQPCAACGAWGYSQNAHVLGNDGAGRKGHFTTITPLCGVRPDEQGSVYEGCHSLFDTKQDEFRARFPTFSPKRACRETQRQWRAFLNGEKQR